MTEADTLRGDFEREIATQHEQVKVNLSFSDNYTPDPNIVYGSCLLQIGENDDGMYTCAYLNKTQLHQLLVAISDALGTFDGKKMGIRMEDITFADEK